MSKHYFLRNNQALVISLTLLCIEVALNLLIIWRVPYTEIDWKAYMEEVEGFLSGERNYLNIRGNTGPLVYPAGFLYIFAALHWITSSGTHLLLAQFLFMALYGASFALVCFIYGQTAPQTPPWLVIFLVLSKRMHSIYTLRLFNDPVAMFFMYISIGFLLKQRNTMATVFISLALSVKMNILLFMPGFAFILLVRKGLVGSLKCAGIFIAIQALIGYPFLAEYPLEYLSKAFELSRAFLYKWTVNWKCIDEDTFETSLFANSLLFAFGTATLLFMHFKWANRQLPSIILESLRYPFRKPSFLAPSNSDIVTILFTGQFIGICFSRSLHYQFYSWYFWTLPYMAWYAISDRLDGIWRWAFVAVFLGAIEVCWNTFPATFESSALLQFCHALLLILLWLKPSNQKKVKVK